MSDSDTGSAPPASWTYDHPAAIERSAHRGQLAVQAEADDGHVVHPLPRSSLLLGETHRMLPRRVGMHHDVRVVLRRQAQTPREVRVEDVEPARAKLELGRLCVDEHDVPFLHRACEARVRDARRAVDLEPRQPFEPFADGRHRPPAEAQRHQVLARDVDEGERHLDHSLEVVHRDVLVGRVDVGHPVREVDAGRPACVEDVRVGRTTGEPEVGPVPNTRERVGGDPDRQVVVSEPVAAVLRLDAGLERAFRHARGEGRGVDQLLDDLRDPGMVMGAHLCLDRAALGDDVSRRAAADHADVRRGRARRSGRGACRRSPVRPRRSQSDPPPGTSPRARRDRRTSASSSCAEGEPVITSPIGAAWS